MNYEPLISDQISSFKEECPEMNYCEIIYSILREMGVKKINELLKKKDSEFYRCVVEAKNFEKEEPL